MRSDQRSRVTTLRWSAFGLRGIRLKVRWLGSVLAASESSLQDFTKDIYKEGSVGEEGQRGQQEES